MWSRLFEVVVNQMFCFQVVCCFGGDGIWRLAFGQAKVRAIKMDGLPSRAAFERFLSSYQSQYVESLVSYVFSLLFPCVIFPCFLSYFSYFPRIPALSSSLSRLFCLGLDRGFLTASDFTATTTFRDFLSSFRLGKRTAALWACSCTAVDLSDSKLPSLHAVV